MEVAGLVLGVIPLVIKALHTYQTILSSMKSAQRDLGDMILKLTTEQQILQNTCQILLKDIVPHSQLGAITADPFDPAWESYDEEVNARLDQSSAIFRQNVTSMKDAVDELQQKLAVTGDGETKFNSRKSLLEALKRSASEASFAMSFTLKKKDYASILDRIEKGNTTLQRLLDSNRELEPTRRSGSQFKLARLIRDLSRGIFTAIQNALECNCASHDFGLEIEVRKTTMLLGHKEDGIAKPLHFDIVVRMDDQIQTQRWDRIRVQLADRDLPPDLAKTPSSSNPLSSSPRSKSPRRVKFASIVPVHGPDRNVLGVPGNGHISQLPVSGSARPSLLPTPIKNLCHVLQKGKGITCDCYGYITDTSRKFNLYAERCHPETYIAVRLRKVLEERHQRFDYTERLQVALLLSYSVLHHYNTPWLAKMITVDDVIFFREEATPNACASSSLDKPLLAKHLPIRPMSATPASTYHTAEPIYGITRRVNWALLSLGFLLIQIITGSTVVDLEITNEIDVDCLLEKREKAYELSQGRQVERIGGQDYALAARWCLDNFLKGVSLEDEKFCREFHREVIDRLETDLKHQSITF